MITDEAVTLMGAGTPAKFGAVADGLGPVEIVELQRTGSIVLSKLARRRVKLRAVKDRSG